MKPIHILFIGAGRMAEAIFSGILQNEDNIFLITVTNETDSNQLTHLEKTYPTHTSSDWRKVIKDADVILLACPPAAHEPILKAMSTLVSEKQFAITVAAGIGPSYLEERLEADVPVAWLMPNTAADIGQSMSIYTFGKFVTYSERELFSTIISAIGTSEELTEEQVHHLTAITGSAPAFLYLFVEALEQSAISYGLSDERARKLVTSMVSGSVEMLKKYKDPAKLRAQVTSSGGATALGLASLADDGFITSLHKCNK